MSEEQLTVEEYLAAMKKPECYRDDYDPTPWCHVCGAMEKSKCDCGPYAENH